MKIKFIIPGEPQGKARAACSADEIRAQHELHAR